MTVAYIGLGANLGMREETLRRAVELLGAADGVDVLAVSKLRETEPVGVVDQPPFLNGAVAVETAVAPRDLLDLLLEIERSLGRVREERWGPRTIDLDLLVYGTRSSTSRACGCRIRTSMSAGSRSSRWPSSRRSSTFRGAARCRLS